MSHLYRRPGAVDPVEKPTLTTATGCVLSIIALATLAGAGAVQAQGVPPITPSGLNTVVTTHGDVHNITGGTRPANGPNLFHSLGTFNVPTNNIANFLNDAALPTTNILGRVTGGDVSSIFGTIQTTGFGQANLFLMNPAGFLFGPTATLNVGGMVTFTSADYLRFSDNAKFNAAANPTADALLSIAPVAAFGFLGSNPGAITVQGSQLSVAPGQGLALVGGNITIEGATLAPNQVQPSRLTAPGGQINLASMASAGEVSASNFQPASPMTGGAITLAQGSGLDVSADTAGIVRIRGGQFTMADASIKAISVNGNGPVNTSPTISITAETVALHNGAYITADTLGTAPAGDITFNAGTMTADGTGPIRLQVTPESLITNPDFSKTGILIESTSISPAAGAGSAGRITIQGLDGPGSLAKTVTLKDTILHTRSFGGTSATTPGAITITADSLALSDQAEIYTTANGSAPAGTVALNVNELRSNVNPDGSFIDNARAVLLGSPSEKFDSTAGQPGTVTISGPGPESTDPARSVTLSNTEIDTFVVSGSMPPPGTVAGPIVITADTVSLNNLTILVTTSAGAAPAGNIVLNANNLRVNVNSDGTPITSAHRVFLNSPGGGLDSNGGPAGTVTISGISPESTDPAQSVSLYNMSITTAVEGGHPGLPPGTITITADQMNIGGETEIYAFTSSSAPAGNIVLNVNELRVNVNPDGTLINERPNDPESRSLIASESFVTDGTAGRAGTVTISGIGPELTDAARLIALNNTELSTTIKGGTAATLPASIAVITDTLTITNSPNVSTATSGGAPAGHITFQVTNLTADQGTKISSSTSGPGPGGTISVTAGQSVALNHGSSITASSTGPADAGDITINAGRTFASTDSSVTTEAAQASGGNITVLATDSVRLTNSQLNASVQGSSTTVGGNIVIDPQTVILQNSQIVANATQGQGGNISITTQSFLADATSVIDASSQFGISGTVNIQSPTAQMAGRLVALPNNPLTATALLSQRCAALTSSGQFSSFVVAGRYGVPPEPGGWLTSPLVLDNVAPEVATSRDESWFAKAGSDSLTEPGILSIRRRPVAGTTTRFAPADWTEGCGS
ncbi:MAG TPA: filamentous hemagglutinin N-terminal domain-containing protein [Nitrospiraceae bacterium]|nr:filamentous hemagglutinin N-terminal domain-containing protein [Nitrospiraceae bacterium]